MKSFFQSIIITFFLLNFHTGTLNAQNQNVTPQRLWKAEKDAVYLQEVAQKIPTEKPVSGIAFFEK